MLDLASYSMADSKKKYEMEGTGISFTLHVRHKVPISYIKF